MPDTFPIGYLRDLTANERAAVRRMATMEEFCYQGKPTMWRIAVAVFGSRDPERTAKIKHAIDEGERPSERPSECQTDNKVIRLPRRVAQ